MSLTNLSIIAIPPGNATIPIKEQQLQCSFIGLYVIMHYLCANDAQADFFQYQSQAIANYVELKNRQLKQLEKTYRITYDPDTKTVNTQPLQEEADQQEQEEANQQEQLEFGKFFTLWEKTHDAFASHRLTIQLNIRKALFPLGYEALSTHLDSILTTFSAIKNTPKASNEDNTFRRGFELAEEKITQTLTPFVPLVPYKISVSDPSGYDKAFNGICEWHLAMHLPKPVIHCAGGGSYDLGDFKPQHNAVFDEISKAKWLRPRNIHPYSAEQLQLIDFALTNALIKQRPHQMGSYTQWLGMANENPLNQYDANLLYQVIATHPKLAKLISDSAVFLKDNDEAQYFDALMTLKKDYKHFLRQYKENKSSHDITQSTIFKIKLKINTLKQALKFELCKIPVIGQPVTISSLMMMMVSMAAIALIMPGWMSGMPLIGPLIFHAPFWLKLSLIAIPTFITLVSLLGASRKDLVLHGFFPNGMKYQRIDDLNKSNQVWAFNQDEMQAAYDPDDLALRQ
ncbi:MAG: hypothetical protein ACON5A_03200 [Candidatus Comchoanobacterales bacterium]